MGRVGGWVHRTAERLQPRAHARWPWWWTPDCSSLGAWQNSMRSARGQQGVSMRSACQHQHVSVSTVVDSGLLIPRSLAEQPMQCDEAQAKYTSISGSSGIRRFTLNLPPFSLAQIIIPVAEAAVRSQTATSARHHTDSIMYRPASGRAAPVERTSTKRALARCSHTTQYAAGTHRCALARCTDAPLHATRIPS